MDGDTTAAARPVGGGTPRKLTRAFIANATLLMSHEIDAAYWREWRLFSIPGGIEGFLAFNVVVVLVVLWGLVALSEGRRAGRAVSWLLVAFGVFAFGVHVYFVLAGRPEFATVGSWVVLGGALLASMVQAYLLVGTRGAGPSRA